MPHYAEEANLLPLESRSPEEIGHLWENYVIAERFKMNVNESIPPRMFFWRTHKQQEVDYIEEDATGLSAWEMKWNAKKATGSLPASFRSAYPNARTDFVTPESIHEFL